MEEKKFETPFTSQEKKKLELMTKKGSPLEVIMQETPFAAEENVKNYFKLMQNETKRVFEAAENAKKMGVDLSDTVEVTPAVDLADRAETIIGLPGLAKIFRDLYAEAKDRRKAYFKLFQEILEEKWWKMPEQERVEIGIKACLLIETEGVVVAPLDGVPKVEINTNPDGSKYVDIYFAGPIRAAGGSSTVVPLILADYARTFLKLDRYKPTQDEVERYVEEIGIYQTEVISRQYIMSDEEIRIIINGCPVCINGVPTEEVEVSAHRDLARIPTNRIRGGMGLVVSEGLALKALWVMRTAKELGLNWDFLEKIVKVEKTQTKIEVKPNKAFLDRLAAGRPILAYPSAWGGFRLRYGRGRNTGIMAKAINPGTMIMLDEFIAVGTHGRIERPGKATQFFPCTTIDGPVVLLKDGTVMRINSTKEAEAVKPLLEKIIYLGDLLATYGDFRKSAHPLVPAGYCEEWWQLDLQKACTDEAKKKKLGEMGFIDLLKVRIPELQKVSEKDAIAISRELGVPLHPKFIHFYRAINAKELTMLREYLKSGKIEETEGKTKITIEYKSEEKKLMEKIGLPHNIFGKSIVVDEFALSIIETFALRSDKTSVKEHVLENLSELSGLVIKDKAGSFIGGRMGRPEQAKPRQMKGNPHVLFPIGLKGGSTRSIVKAVDQNYNESGKVTVEISEYICPQCKKISLHHRCYDCKIIGVRLNYCKACGKSVTGEKCGMCGGKTVRAGEHEFSLVDVVQKAKMNLGENSLPDVVKGVKGMISDSKEVEPIEKGILRAKHDIHIFRDGTTRFELLNAGITHFKPKEINLSVEKVKSLGYSKDLHGKEITSDEQLIEIYPQDVIVNDTCGDWLVRVSQFIDELLVKFYKQQKFYNVTKKEDLIGHMVLGLAPHTSAAVNGRVLGYTKSRLGFGHPYFVCAKRRNIDGDQDSLMLLMDALLNFSNKYLSHKSGGRMDAPLVFTIIINPTEVDDEVHKMETVWNLPLELYEKSANVCEPNVPAESVKDRLGKDKQYSQIGFTHDTEIFDEGPKMSRYVQLKSMDEKIQSQNTLQKKILAVNAKDALERVMGSHFLPDIIGNARAFSRQTFRCTTCNEKYRRIPLCGKCYKCGKNSIILTIHEGSVRKYLKIAQNMARQENLSPYLIQRLGMIEKEINSVFKSDKVQQKSLFEFA
ncbi:DNA polymerase II large subunit [uncultured archaeon]|nr:DNA polymerase II large subunit [uncultured archaeon]